ncbi:MAG: DUF481 domain-containing protein [Kiritimatiellales bacterium]|nr:DUF481 domain-containing protein [Kiritimatiellales bacterium]
MKKIFTLAGLLLIAASGIAQDTVIFSNGDVLTGRILEQNGEEVRLKSAFLGEVTLSVENIKEIIPDGQPEQTAKPVEAAPEPEVAQKSPQPKIADEPVINVVPPKPVPQIAQEEKEEDSWKWSGKAGFGYSVRESETIQRTGEDTYRHTSKENESLRVYGNVETTKDDNHLQWNWNYRYSESDVRKNDDYLALNQIYRRDLTDKTFTRAKTAYAQDYLRDIAQEGMQTAELGMKVVDKPTLKLGASAGGAIHYYERDIEDYSDTSGKFVLDQNLRWQLNKMLTLYENYTHLGNLEEYHLVFKGGLENKLIEDLFVRLEYRLDRDTEVMDDDKTYFDKALITSLLYKF